MFTCFIRYQLVPGRLQEFEEYGRVWISLIEEYGGTHHGYFMPGAPGDRFPEASFSFPGLGREAPPDFGVALFSFQDVAAYDRYRRAVEDDPRCKAATARFQRAPCFMAYERTFLRPIVRGT